MTTETPSSVLEQAPSEVTADEPSLPRILGAGGAGLLLLGIIAVIANTYDGPRWIGVSGGYFAAFLGLGLMLFHALRDGNIEMRRLYGGFGLLALIAAVVAAIAPGPIFSDAIAKSTGYHLLPWTPAFAMVALAFLVAPLRHETDPWFKNMTHLLLIGLGSLICLGCVVTGIANPDYLVGPGILLALVGLAYCVAFLANTDTNEGLGYFLAVGLGLLGAIALAYALGRSIFPTVLADGPSAIKNVYQRTDYWKLAARVISILVFLGLAVWGVRGKGMSVIVRGCLAAIGLAFAGVFIYSTFATTAMPPREPFFVPSGLLMILIGAAYLAVSLGTASDSPFITMVRRELAAYFFSPIGYFVLVGMALLTWVGYLLFIGSFDSSTRTAPAVPEPILASYYAGTIIGPLALLVLIPAITMRLFSEEKRSGALEVLLTAPLSETSIVLSKIMAAWCFFMLCWVPMGLYLIALRVVGEQPFDYRPILSLYIAIAATGFAFVSMGAFFSTLTKNQIVAAVMTFVVCAVSFFLSWHRFFPNLPDSVKLTLEAASRTSYWTLWQNSLGGQLQVRDLVLQLSIGVFWTFLTLKSLEARKWG